MATILITGGSGMIGKAITKALLEKDHRVIILSRDPVKERSESKPEPRVTFALWNVNDQTIDVNAISSADHIIHLAGAGVADKRWTKKRKQEIVDSRVKSGELIVRTLAAVPHHVRTIVSASAIGWYGPDPVVPNPRPFSEEDPAFTDFLGRACKQWENAIEPVAKSGIRLVKVRTGIVLSDEGGALHEFEKPLNAGIAAVLSKGRQVISWIHIDDLVRIYIAAIENETMNGVYNAVAPHPVSNKTFTLQLAAIKRGKFFIPLHVPSIVLKLALGEMSIEVLKSTTVSSAKLHLEGFEFLYSSSEAALKSLVK
ncbi:MAG: TIGR01777 family protein [Chitinophagaceae bacterium]|nr:TIGR01777 family protein [Chitinophagaceae bacterium]